MRYFITAAVLTVATITGAEAKPPSGGSGSFKKLSTGRNFDLKHSDFKGADFKHTDLKKFDSKGGSVGSGKYLTQYGKKFSQGFFYCGKDHCHWTYCCYWPQYRCDCYYCPDACVWYYYCEPRQCYLPVSCVEYAPPTVVNDATATATAVNSVNVNVNSSAPVDLPPVMPAGPAGSSAVQPFKAPPMK